MDGDGEGEPMACLLFLLCVLFRDVLQTGVESFLALLGVLAMHIGNFQILRDLGGVSLSARHA